MQDDLTPEQVAEQFVSVTPPGKGEKMYRVMAAGRLLTYRGSLQDAEYVASIFHLALSSAIRADRARRPPLPVEPEAD